MTFIHLNKFSLFFPTYMIETNVALSLIRVDSWIFYDKCSNMIKGYIFMKFIKKTN